MINDAFMNGEVTLVECEMIVKDGGSWLANWFILVVQQQVLIALNWMVVKSDDQSWWWMDGQ